MVTVEVATPFAITGPEPAIVELATTGTSGLMTNEELSTVKEPAPPLPEVSALVAVMTLEPMVSRERPLPAKSATPATAVTVKVPDRVPVEPAFRLKVMSAVASAPLVTTLPCASLILITGCGLKTLAATDAGGWVLNTKEVAAPLVKVTRPPILTTGVAIERVLTSATVLVNVQVETPEAFEIEQAL
jgi:hypothetical protein